jgi:hypothetical protein
MNTPFDPSWTQADGRWPVDLRSDPTLRKSFDVLRKKWGEVPFDQYERRMSEDLLRLSDDELLEKWEFAYRGSSTGEAFSVRGWYQTLYRDALRGKKVLDVGCGLAPDTIHYAQHGAIVTFLDICCGSMINAPLEVTRIETQAILQHLPVNGRWIELAYPKVRWEREGRLPETEWGARTDGGAPWMEWHDLQKLEYLLAPAAFEVVLTREFHNADFNWFDLIRRS